MELHTGTRTGLDCSTCGSGTVTSQEPGETGLSPGRSRELLLGHTPAVETGTRDTNSGHTECWGLLGAVSWCALIMTRNGALWRPEERSALHLCPGQGTSSCSLACCCVTPTCFHCHMCLLLVCVCVCVSMSLPFTGC